MRISDWSSDVCSSDLLEVEHVLWRHSVRCLGLQEHPQDPPFTVEVIGICAAESDRERSVNVANREAEGASLYPVDHDPQLRSSEARRFGKECFITCLSLFSPYH